MKAVELRQMDDTALRQKLAEERARMSELRFSLANNQLKQVRDVRKAKQNIAQILTILNSRKQ